MKPVVITLPPHLPSKWWTVATKRMTAVAAKRKQTTRAQYIHSRPSWNTLKRWLSAQNNWKCWYCECKGTRAPFDVDHFRPKLEVTVDGQVLAGHDGYHWLAYEWTNFRLSCQRCNRPERTDDETLCGKANEFPIENEATRCLSRIRSYFGEKPRLLDPSVSADCALLKHLVSGEVEPEANPATWEFQRARYTIDRLGLNKWGAPESKRTAWQPVDLLIRIAGNNPDVAEVLKQRLSDDAEYSSFWRAAIATHRDKPWVSSLL